MSSSSGCCVCDDPSSKEDPIITCEKCAIHVHLYYYGSEEQVKGWKCSPCRLGKKHFVRCRLCLSKGGVMKQTLCQNWVHVICALFTNGVNFSDLVTMEPIDISIASKSKSKKHCSFCYSNQGYSILCKAV